MDYEKNSYFFDHKRIKKWDVVKKVSYIFFVLSAITLIITSNFGYGYVNTIAFLPTVIVGVILLLTALSMTTSESSIKQQLELLRAGAKDEAREAFDYPEFTLDDFFEFEWYDFEATDILVRKNKGGRSYSSLYAMTFFYLEKDKIRIFRKEVSLISDFSKSETLDILYSDISKAETYIGEIETMTISGNNEMIRQFIFRIYGKDGKALISAPNRSADYSLDRLADTINHNVSRA